MKAEDLLTEIGQFSDTSTGSSAYEYRVDLMTVPFPQIDPTIRLLAGQKFILAGNSVPAAMASKSILIVVDDSVLAGISLSLPQYKADLAAEGYRVQQITVPRVDIPRTSPAMPADIPSHFENWRNAVMGLKSQIRTIWSATPDLTDIVLIGHVAVPYSGTAKHDGHAEHQGAWPADVFYGVLSTPDSVWTDTASWTTYDDNSGTHATPEPQANYVGDGKFDTDELWLLGSGADQGTHFADVSVGRIDFSTLSDYLGLPPTVGSVASAKEITLLNQYLTKNHDYRTGMWNIDRKALFQERSSSFAYYYDTNRLTPNVGLNNIELGTVSPPGNTVSDDYDLNNHNYLWLYAAGPGQSDHARIEFDSNRYLFSSSYADPLFGGHHAVFNYIAGSYLADWDHPNDLLRAVIAESNGYGLVAMSGSNPNVNQHQMALGWTIGQSVLRGLNNFGDRQGYGLDAQFSNVRVAIMGDPTLRQDNIKAVGNLTVTTTQDGEPGTSAYSYVRNVSWTPSAEIGVNGYYIYWSPSRDGGTTGYILLNPTPVAVTTWNDPNPSAHNGGFYMVRSTKLTETPSGSYYNLSAGAIAAAPVATTSVYNWKDSNPSQNPALDHPQTIDFTLAAGAPNSVVVGSVPIAGQIVLSFSGDLYGDASGYVPMIEGTSNDFTTSFYNDGGGVKHLLVSIRHASAVQGAGVLDTGRYSIKLFTPTSRYEKKFLFLTGDTNNDGAVNYDDLQTVAQNYGQSSSNSLLDFVANSFGLGDFNNDDQVDFLDLVILTQRYGITI